MCFLGYSGLRGGYGRPRRLHRLRLRGRSACSVEPAMQQSAGLAAFFFGGKVDVKKKPKLPKVPL